MKRIAYVNISIPIEDDEIKIPEITEAIINVLEDFNSALEIRSLEVSIHTE